MRNSVLLFSVLMLLSSPAFAQDKMPYRIYNGKGKHVRYSKMVKAATKADVVLFGEHHDNSIVHWLELEFAKDLNEKRKIILGAEMIEADNQQALDDYLSGKILQKQLDSVARLWPNHKTDYKPLVDFAKNSNLRFIATNVPRRYASIVYKGGFEKLDELADDDKRWIAPLPIKYDPTLPGYVKMVQEMGGHGGANLPKAQAIKDATMAHFILMSRIPGTLLIHYNGTYHSDFHDGIYWYLKSADASLNVVTIATVSQKNLTFDKENYNKADFIIVTDEDVIKTY